MSGNTQYTTGSKIQMSECKYCGGDCHEQVLKNGEARAEFLCDGYAGDIDNLYGEIEDE